MGNEKTDWMIYSDREMSVMSAQEEKVSFKELIKSLGMTQKEFSETFGIPMGTLRHWISGDRECPVYTKRMLAYMVELKRQEAAKIIQEDQQKIFKEAFDRGYHWGGNTESEDDELYFDFTDKSTNNQ